MRIPFEEAIEDERLFKTAFDELSWFQRTVLKAFYGLPLSGKLVNPENGRSELDYWAIVQGSCEYDDLGYVTKVTPIPYVPKEYEQLWAVLGRRAGKTSQLMSFIVAYEAVLGGHEDYIGRKQQGIIYLIAQRLGLAVSNLSHVRAIVETSDLLAGEIVDNTAKDVLAFKNGIRIEPSPPSLKAQRGFAIPVVGMDEVAFWYTDAESANPDVEVQRAVEYAQAQFPYSKQIGISTPWTKEGLLYSYHQAGTEGVKLPSGVDKSKFADTMVAFGPTAACENPRITRKKLQQLKLKDPEAFDRESLCKYLDAVSGFFNHSLLAAAHKAATEAKTAERPPKGADSSVRPTYVAAMDPAFRQDDFAFTIVHKEGGKVVQDVVKRWTPIRGQKLNPVEILAEIKPYVEQYEVSVVYTDQYQFESLQQLALQQDIAVEVVDFTGRSKSKIFGNLQQLVNQQKLELLDPYTNDTANEQLHQLQELRKRLTAQNAMQISAPEGKQDDLAAVLALAAHKAAWLDPFVTTPAEEEYVYKEPTLFERGMATIRKRQMMGNS